MKCEFKFRCIEYKKDAELCISYENKERVKKCKKYKNFVLDEDVENMKKDDKMGT